MDDKGAETGSRVTTTGVSQDREETAGNSGTEDTDTGIQDEGEGRTEERTDICAGTTTGVSQDREETAGSSRTEDPDTVIEDEGEGGTEERTEICAGTPLMATNAYTKNQDSPIGSFRVRSTNFLLNLRDPTPISMKFGTLGDYA